jgi:dTDP-4-dehydrorhamnose 3,5-epimerase
MGKLMRVTSGSAFLVTVDLRPSSPTFLKWLGKEVSEDNGLQIWAPADFARGICSLTDNCIVQYKTTGMFDPKGDSAIRWDDPHIGIDWPVKSPIMSARDKAATTVDEYFGDRL